MNRQWQICLAVTMCVLAQARCLAAASGAYLRQSAQYTAYPGADSTNWAVTLNNVQAGSAIYVVGTWPNWANSYPTMQVTDGANTYTLLDRYDDKTVLNFGIQGTQSMGHWYAANVRAGSYSINMAPTPSGFEDWVGIAAFEIAGTSSVPIDGHTLNFQADLPPGSNTVNATVSMSAASGLLLAVTFDDIDYTVPTVPLIGSGFSDAGSLWNFNSNGKTNGYAARAEYAAVASAGDHTATFSPQEGESGGQYPDYMSTAAVFANGTTGADTDGPMPTWALGALGMGLLCIGSRRLSKKAIWRSI